MASYQQVKFPGWRQLLFLWMLLLPLITWAQSGISVTWDFQVGCIEFNSEFQEDKPRDNFEVWEEIEPGKCIRVCEQSRVKYTLNGPNASISSVTWGAAGGTIVNTTTSPHTATVQWGNSGNGALTITIVYGNQTQETKTICIEKIDGPNAEFALAGMGGNEVCMNTPIYFDNLSTAGGGTGIVSYEWDFGDGSPTTSVFEPVHTYTSGGPKTVRLKVTNQCNCTREYEMDITVNVANPVQISCSSVVCEGATEIYTASNTCKGEWKVIGGTIQNINGNQISVTWDHVDPADGFGYVMYKSECGCPAWTTLKIPVVVQNAVIQGPVNACTGKQYKYELPRWPTTQTQWYVNGPAQVQTTYNAQRNEVYLKFSTPGTYTLTSNYFNTLVRCEGQSETLTIHVTEPLIITGGQPEVCIGSGLTFNSNAGGNAVWQVTYNGNIVHTETNVNLNYNFQNAGTYLITATSPGGGCTGDGVMVKVLPLPPAPTGTIAGPEPVCAGIPYTYTLTPSTPGVIPVWSVTGGTIQGSNTGTSVTVVFTAGAPVYSVGVQNRSAGGLGCLSKKKTRTLQKVDLNSISIISPQANNTYCPSSSATFIANFNGIVPDDYSWSFASGNFGSLLPHPTNPNAIIANFNEISGGISQSTLILNGVKCGQPFQKTVVITLQQLPVISMNSGTVCEGSPTFPVTVNLPANLSSGTLIFTFPNGNTQNLSVNPGGGTQTFTLNNQFNNTTTSVTTQTLQVKLISPNGCNYVATSAANFSVIPELDVTITPGYHYGICPTTAYSEVLTGSVPSAGAGVTYQWYKNGTPIPGATGNTYTIDNTTQPSPGGIYYLRVIVDGCPSQSPDIYVQEVCISAPGCPITPNPNLTVSATWTSCNTIVATASFIGAPNSFTWSGSPYVQLQPGSTSTSATFTVDREGIHNIRLVLDYSGCKTSKSVDVIKNYEPKFTSTITCNANGTYSVTLTDTSLLSGITSSQIGYSFTMNNGSQQNGQTATYTGLTPGQQYAFAIKLNGPGAMPDCVYTENITMPVIPSTQFSVSQTTVCKGEKIILSIPPANFLPNHIYKWIFDGTAFIASQNTTEITINHLLQNAQISLVVTTPENCIYTSNPVPINVNEPNGNVLVSSNNVNVCAGSIPQPQLIANVLGGTGAYFEWMNGTQNVSNGTSPVFQPTTSGSYWVIVTDATNGCKDKSSANNPVPVIIRSAPNVSIVGSSQVCQNNTVTLQGVVTDSNLNYEWTRTVNGGSPTVVQTGTSATPVIHTSAPLAAGIYVYTLKVWSAADPGCSGSSSFIVTVSTPPAAPQLQMQLLNCQPYRVKLSVQSPGAGTYNWSNGMTGPVITVSTGGLYNVIYTAPSGCTSSQQISVPHSLEDLMWIFPAGCYDLCPGDGYVIGPRGVYDYHEWQYFGNNEQGGSGFIDPFFPQQPGSYQLFMEHGGCQLVSGTMNISPSVNNPECMPRDCKLDVVINEVVREGNTYLVYGEIFNFGTQAVTVTVSSANNNGYYLPAPIPIMAGSSYSMNPLIFYPDPSFPGGVDTMLITAGNPECYVKMDVVMGEGIYTKAANATPNTDRNESEIRVAPNPASEEVTILYDTGNSQLQAESLYVYDRGGKLQHKQKLQHSKGEIKLDVRNWLQGMYLVTITTGEDPLQAKILKE